MLPYSSGLILDNTSNYGIVKTATVFGFGPSNQDKYVNENFNSSKSLEWIIAHGNFSPTSLQGAEARALHSGDQIPKPKTAKKKKKHLKSKKKRKAKGKTNKCILKLIKKDSRKNKRGGNKSSKMRKKYMMPLILGLLAAKSLLIPIALKALAFLSAKGLMMGFFSTVLASVLSLKGMFDHSHHYQNRKDDTKTQVEIIQVPSKTEDHIYYDEHHNKRGDFVPVNEWAS